jgi:hypothetical protein
MQYYYYTSTPAPHYILAGILLTFDDFSPQKGTPN